MNYRFHEITSFYWSNDKLKANRKLPHISESSTIPEAKLFIKLLNYSTVAILL